ncbi:MAG: COX15/CtaA family protein [Chloroherpetonaceae bacterium]|nr:COX15/CtaA family protein [Chloroherpetonaceae bacterium]
MLDKNQNQDRLSVYFKICASATGITYLLIFLGGLVRVSGAGLGCPDWPKCYGLWIPPISLDQLPAGYDPSTFNATLTWIEYINRLFGVLTGFFILAVFYYTIRYFRSKKNYVIFSLLSLILVIFQGWLGKVVVDSDLEPVIVTLHLIFAILIVSILLGLTIVVWKDKVGNLKFINLEGINNHTILLPIRLLIVIWIISFIQLVLGTQVREQIEHLSIKYPLLEDVHKVDLMGNIGHIHGYLGVFTALLTYSFVYLVLIKLNNVSHEIKKLAVVFGILITVQVFVGVSLVKIGLPEILKLFHQWIATLFLGVLLILFLLLKSKGGVVEGKDGYHHSLRSTGL